MGKINEVYKPLYTSKKRYFCVTGGRGSGKSFAVHEFILRLTYEQSQGILFTRYTMTSAETSIIPEFKQTIERLGLTEHFHITTKDIYNKKTGSFIWFRGIKAGSNAQKANLKSLAGVTTWIVEEGEDFQDEKTFDTIDDSIRSKSHQNRVIWIQNPSTKDHFIYKRWFEKTNKKTKIDSFDVTVSNHPDVEHIHTTFLINRDNLTQSWLNKADNARINDPKWYVLNYLGGWLEKAEGVIFENWTESKFDDSLPYIYGQDYGFAVEGDPTTLVKIAIDKRKNRIYCKEELYKNNMDTDAIVKANKTIAKGKLIVADSAEPRLISDLKKQGCNIVKCVKGQGSVTAGIKLLQGYELVIDPNSSNLKKELNNYIWNDKRSGVPVDEWNHIIDAIRYAVGHLLQRNTHPGISQN